MPEKKRNIVKIMSLVFLVIAAVGIGVTGASISHRMELTNQIRTPTVSVEVREEVGSVEEGLKTKKVKFENTGNADVFLRVSYGETWTYQEGEQRMILPNEPEGKEAAVKNWNTDGSWQEGGDGWFYYTRVLKPKESTPYILTAVDFRRTAELSDQIRTVFPNRDGAGQRPAGGCVGRGGSRIRNQLSGERSEADNGALEEQQRFVIT